MEFGSMFPEYAQSDKKFLDFLSKHREKLKDDKVKKIHLVSVGWNDDTRMHEAYLTAKIHDRPIHLLSDEEGYKNYEHNEEMNDKWKWFVKAVKTYLQLHHMDCPSADAGGRGEITLDIDTLEIKVWSYRHEIVKSNSKEYKIGEESKFL